MLVLRDKALGARVKELISRANAKRNDQGGSCLYDIPPQDDDDDDDDDDEVGGSEASGNAGNAGGSNTGIQSQNEGNEETPSQEKKDAGATDEEEPRILEALEASILRCAIDCINAEKDAVTKGTVDKDTVIEDAVMKDTVDKDTHPTPYVHLFDLCLFLFHQDVIDYITEYDDDDERLLWRELDVYRYTKMMMMMMKIIHDSLEILMIVGISLSNFVREETNEEDLCGKSDLNHYLSAYNMGRDKTVGRVSQNYSWCNGSEFVVRRILRIWYVDAMGELMFDLTGVMIKLQTQDDNCPIKQLLSG
ncbi:hypothetical protein POM88_009623 [Heracleum sosnowskyi]|uniref:Uncharacterized protein n=1 Tax=Heracleum sosnowskyi TaxID=360622 RepID=A0AAD8JC59_9APIA|nr:hypothetical protein POM88_009623 [Heracleum sosnowskyi]